EHPNMVHLLTGLTVFQPSGTFRQSPHHREPFPRTQNLHIHNYRANYYPESATSLPLLCIPFPSCQNPKRLSYKPIPTSYHISKKHYPKNPPLHAPSPPPLFPLPSPLLSTSYRLWSPSRILSNPPPLLLSLSPVV